MARIPDLVEEKSSQQSEINDLKATIVNLENKMEGFEKENDDLNSNLDKLQAKIKKLKIEKGQLKEELRSKVAITPLGQDDATNGNNDAVVTEANVTDEEKEYLQQKWTKYEESMKQKWINYKRDKIRQGAPNEPDCGRKLKKVRTSGSSEESGSMFVRL